MPDETDWDALEHAYDSAGDTPERLTLLLSGDPEACGEVLGFLDAAILHQGSIYSATAPAALFVASILDDPRTLVRCQSALPWDERERPLRAALLEWLGMVADAADHEPDPEYDDLDAVATCQAIRPELYRAVAPFHTDPDESVREAARGAVSFLMAAPELAAHRAAEAERLLRSTPDAASHRERAAVALTLSRWGLAPRDHLADPHPAVRACAALAPALDGDPGALDELRHALADPAAADAWFPTPLPPLDGRFRFTLVEALLRRTVTFEEVLEPALAVAAMTNEFTVEADWGPLLVRAFPDRHSPPLTVAQRRFLTVIADNDNCWGGLRKPVAWFQRVGLPTTRDGLRALLAD